MMHSVGTHLPAGWSVAKISEIAEVNPRLKVPVYAASSTVSFVPMTAVEAETGAIDLSRTRHLSEVRKGYRYFRARDVLFAKITPCMENGKMVVVPRLEHGIGFGSTEFHVLRPHREISPDYLYRFVSAAPFRRDAERHMTGAVGQRRVPTSYLGEQPIPIPPAKEQCRIAAKIDELFSALEAGIESLKKARAQLATYRQAALKHAFEGNLTAHWREENRDILQTPEQLLTTIKEERVKHHRQKLRDWWTAVAAWDEQGTRGAKPRSPRTLPTVAGLSRDVISKLPTLADSWAWGKLAWMTCGVEYGTATKSAPSGEVPVLRMGNVRGAKLDLSDLVYTSDRDEIDKFLLHDGDVLFNRTNSPELVGKTAIYRGSEPAIFAGYLIRVNHIRSVVDGQYLNLFLNSQVARHYGSSVKTDGVNQSNISGAKLRSYPFPYCSIEEQRKIVSNLASLLSLADKLENEIVEQLDSATVLRQAILKRAFSGQLVSEDPNDEPASVLLDRIGAERKQLTKRPRHRKTESN